MSCSRNPSSRSFRAAYTAPTEEVVSVIESEITNFREASLCSTEVLNVILKFFHPSDSRNIETSSRISSVVPRKKGKSHLEKFSRYGDLNHKAYMKLLVCFLLQ